MDFGTPITRQTAALGSFPTSKYPGSEVKAIVALPQSSTENLVEVVQRVSLAQDMEQIMTIVCSATRQLTGADGASFVLRDDDNCFYADEEAVRPLWKGQRFTVDTCISGWVMNNREPVSIPDVYEDPRIPLEIYRTTFVRSLAMVPIRTQNPIGAIGNYWATTHSPTPDQLRILQIIADSTAVAIQNILAHQEFEERIRLLTEKLEAASEELQGEAQLRKQLEAKILQLSLIDELTGLNNRRGFLLRAEQMLKLVNRFETHGWLIYIDLDGLKRVNDELGRDAGDQLVRNVARILRESFRDSDVIGRIGGDEFIVFTTGSSTPAVEIEERITRNIEHHNRCYPDQIPISMSIGVIRCDPHSIHTLEDMIHQADAAMYIEKRRKRERLRNGIHH